MAPIISENAEWLSVLSYTTVLAYPFALQAALKLNVFEILSKHGKLSAQQITHLIPSPISNPNAPVLLDRLLHLLSSATPTLPSPLLAASLSPPPPSSSSSSDKPILEYSLLPPSKYFLKDDNGVSIGEWMCKRNLQFLDAYSHLDSVIAEGGDGYHKAFGGKISDHIAHHAGEMDVVMASFTSMFMAQFLEVYDGFKGVGTLVDVGGSTGSTLIHILDKHPHLEGINMDQPHIVAKGLTHPRLKHVGGNMLESIPPADAVLMKLILHDWEDDECVKILRNCKSAFTSEKGKVIIVEAQVADLVDDLTPIHQFDILMMCSHGGKSRTVEDYKSLGKAAGFSDVKVACIVNEYFILEFLV